MTKSVYLDDKKYVVVHPHPDLIEDMRERKIIPDNVPDKNIVMLVWGAGSWQMRWTDGFSYFTYNPWTALIAKKEA